jgi:benzoyl-CoA reductase/2-hydroxyglutaryl-CoA dehydratase subunit BcrC/BadD/HgdB
MRANRLADLTVGLISAHIPRELVYALGCIPVRVFPSAAKPTAAEAFLPRNFCVLSRLVLASFLEDAQPKLDAVVFADEDDATRRLHDVWQACVNIPVWGFVEVPRLAGAMAASRYAELLMQLAADLEARTGRSLSADSLRQAIDLYNRQRNWLADLKSYWQVGSLKTASYRRLRRMALTQDPLTANQQLQEVLHAAKEAPEQAGGSLDPEASTTASSPGLLLLAEQAAPASLVSLVEADGARVVAEDSDLDGRDVADSIPADADTLEGLLHVLALAYLSTPPSPRRRDLPRRLDYLSRLVAQREVRGAICAYGKFCDLQLAEYPILREHLEGQGVPVLLLELENEAISGQHRTRVEAFLEMLSKGASRRQPGG